MRDNTYIFLDIDGVLVSGECMHRYQHGEEFDLRATRQLRRLIKQTGAQIVVSSAWRWRGFDALQKKFAQEKLLIHDLLDLEDDSRGDLIRHWCREHSVLASQFVILDDEEFQLEGLLHRLVRTDFNRGMTAADRRRVVQMLKG